MHIRYKICVTPVVITARASSGTFLGFLLKQHALTRVLRLQVR